MSAGERKRCLDAGASDYIPKPVDTAELLHALGQWLPRAPVRGAPTRCTRLMAGRSAIADVDDAAELVLPRSSSSTTTLRKRIAIRAMLEPLGHEIVEADSGRAALRAVLRQTFAVILMDVQMPTMDGYETAKLIRLRPQSEHTPIIFVTRIRRRRSRDSATAYASGAVDFIFAPIVPSILRAKVTVFVELFLQSQDCERSSRVDHGLSVAASQRGAHPVGAAERRGWHRHGEARVA